MSRLVCQKCKFSGPVISKRHKDFRRCGFDHTGTFTESNYCCATLNDIRSWAHHFNLPVFNDDHWTLKLLINDVDRWVIRWYKGRGATMYMSINGFPATLENVEKHFPSMLIDMPVCEGKKQSDGTVCWYLDYDATSKRYQLPTDAVNPETVEKTIKKIQKNGYSGAFVTKSTCRYFKSQHDDSLKSNVGDTPNSKGEEK